jgi:hypothetical protein
MSFLDDLIREAMARGEFDNLPGAGKPLPPPDDAHTPEHLRLAHRLLRDNGLAPDWILEGRALDEEADALRAAGRRMCAARASALQAASAAAAPSLARRDADTAWEAQRQRLAGRLERYNRRALTFNLKAPAGVAHKPIVLIEHVLRQAHE